jgi:hypothetical protein
VLLAKTSQAWESFTFFTAILHIFSLKCINFIVQDFLVINF